MIGFLPAMFKREQTKILSSEFLRFFDLFDLLFNLIQHLFHAPLSKWKTHCQVPSALFAAIGRWKCVVDGWCIIFFLGTSKLTNPTELAQSRQINKHQEIDVASACGPVLQLIHQLPLGSGQNLDCVARIGQRPWYNLGINFVDPPVLSQKCFYTKTFTL